MHIFRQRFRQLDELFFLAFLDFHSGNKRHHGEIEIDLSTAEETETKVFVDSYLDSEPNRLDEAFRTALTQHTSGHALFTVELLHAMQERGDLVLNENGQWGEIE